MIIRLTEKEYLEVVRLGEKDSAKWPVMFSCNGSAQVWPSNSSGHSIERERRQLAGQYPVLDEIVSEVLRKHKKGGRFGVNRTGAFYAGTEDKIATIIVRD